MARATLPPISLERISDVIGRVLGSFLAGGKLSGDEVDDVRSEVMVRVLRQFERPGDGEQVRDAEAYIAAITINTANELLRGRQSAPAPLDDRAGEAIDHSAEPQEVFATRQLLVLLWSEVQQLPLMQRRALLLHARDENGGSAIPLLIFTGVATLDEIATVLEYARPVIEGFWDRLPMPDVEIASLLTRTRDQVISLRRSARERLERARRRLILPGAERTRSR